MQITFEVMSVPKPLLSTSALKRREVTIIFNQDYDRIIFGTKQCIWCRTIVILTCESHWRPGGRKNPSWHEEQARTCISRDCDSNTRTMANCRRHGRHARPHNRKVLVSVLDGTTVHARILAVLQLGAWHEGHIPSRLTGPSERGRPHLIGGVTGRTVGVSTVWRDQQVGFDGKRETELIL